MYRRIAGQSYHEMGNHVKVEYPRGIIINEVGSFTRIAELEKELGEIYRMKYTYRLKVAWAKFKNKIKKIF